MLSRVGLRLWASADMRICIACAACARKVLALAHLRDGVLNGYSAALGVKCLGKNAARKHHRTLATVSTASQGIMEMAGTHKRMVAVLRRGDVRLGEEFTADHADGRGLRIPMIPPT